MTTFDLLPGGVQHETYLLAEDEQHEPETLHGGEQCGPALLGDDESDYDLLEGGEQQAPSQLL